MSRIRMMTAAAGAALLAACGSGGDAALTIGLTYVPDVQFAPLYVAEHEGYFDDEGADVTLRHHGAAETLFGALASGEEDLIIAGGDEMLQAFTQGVDVRTVGTLYQEYPLAIAARAETGIAVAEDLAGHTLGLPGPFGENWFALLATLDAADLGEDDLTIDYIGYTAQTAMVTQAVDAVAIFKNNDLLGIEAAGVEVNLVETPELPLVGISVGARGDVIDAHPDDVAAILRALTRAIEFIVADPEATMDIVAQYVPEMDREFSRSVLDATVPLYGDDWLALNSEVWPEMYEFMLLHDLAEPDADPHEAYEDLDWAS